MSGAASQPDLPFVVAMTGASGAIYGKRLLEVLLDAGRHVHLIISSAAARVIAIELDRALEVEQFDPASLGIKPTDRLRYWRSDDFTASIASGSFRTAGMAIVPCSLGTLAAVAQGLTINLIHRAAEVHLKERRPLILVPRETPLYSIALENMLRATSAGAVVLPAMPGFYSKPATIDELVDFVVNRICDHLGVAIELAPRWRQNPAD